MKKLAVLLAGLGTFAMLSSMILRSGHPQAAEADGPRRAEILFLGNLSKHHDSGKYAPSLAIDLFARNINITYTTDTADLNPATLGKYDGMIIYANYDKINPLQEKALKDFVEGGKGLIPLHCASACFTNSDWYIQAVGGKFKSHGTGVFKTTTVLASHPVMNGVNEFASWDESYVHERVNPDKTVLQERTNSDGTREPWTWVRTQGKGRVFYTAGGHNDSTWTQPDFVKLIGNGVLWAIGDKVAAEVAAFHPPVLKYNDTTIVPNYPRPVPYTSLNATPARAPRYQYALSAEESMKTMQVPSGFEVKLFASEPDITNPIAMQWDEHGRLWIVESVDYPNTFVETDGASNDRIKICEDTDGDGKADKFTVFADKLNIPTSLVFANGGIIVSMAPGFLFLKDTNGDDKADIRQTIGSGWGKGDTHAGPSNLQYGFDNKIWGVLGYSGYSGKIDGPNNGVRPAQALYRLNPDGTQLEFLAQSTNNTWGLGFTEDNHVFVSTANGDHSDYFSMPARYMQYTLPPATVTAAAPTGPGNRQGRSAAATLQPLQIIQGHLDMHTLTPNLRQVDVWGGFTAAAGHHFYTARNYPKEYWNRVALINEPTGRLLHRGIIERKGAGFTEKDGWNLLASNDEWVGPVQAEVGPDGNVWVADWYNYIIQHNPTPGPNVSQGKQFKTGQGNAYETPMRDIQYGRIYRIVYKNGKSFTPVKLSKNDLQGLINALKSDNMFWRMTAQRLLVEAKNPAAPAELYKIINNRSVDEIGLNGAAVNALWTLSGLKAFTAPAAVQVATQALSHPAAGVRRAAAEVLPKTQATAAAILRAGLLTDKDLNVRMHAMVVLAGLPASAATGEALYKASADPQNAGDEWIAKALLAAAANNRAGFIAALPMELQMTDLSSLQALTLPQRVLKALTSETYSYMILPADAPASRVITPFPIDVRSKELTIRTTVGPRGFGGRNGGQQQQQPTASGPVRGFIIGQGGALNGFGLYLQDGKVNFVVKQNGKTYRAVTTDPLPDRFALQARLATDGTMSVLVDQQPAASAKAPSGFVSALPGLVRFGADKPVAAADKMGTYPGSFDFTGTAQDLSINLTSKLTHAGHTMKPSAPARVVPAAPKGKTLVLEINTVPEAMKFDTKLFMVKAGQKVIINFNNNDSQLHNLVIGKPGSLNKIGMAANALAADPKGLEKGYVPDIAEVIESTPLLKGDANFTLEFTAPARPGDYPFMCTFPGHWMMMNGIMRVQP
ncbi:PVC-type heme-binding CxxCH protein [Hufsiella ginkgonis]|uniref:Dehydrogenase n=1 Tax=Hufsiella ginkgonis TaxID=2695274 RepID=A0A7K1Y102_9SPHI|nr:PVC-type heme-binding CxxCH protein [Hufsiella ginkgonis]MXV16787.1 dehydrogenase [Hufsiella ginkgonis]